MQSIRWKNAFAVAARSLIAARWNAAAAVPVLSVAAAAGHSETAIRDSVIGRQLSWRNEDEIVEASVEAIRESREETRESEDSPASALCPVTQIQAPRSSRIHRAPDTGRASPSQRHRLGVPGFAGATGTAQPGPSPVPMRRHWLTPTTCQ